MTFACSAGLQPGTARGATQKEPAWRPALQIPTLLGFLLVVAPLAARADEAVLQGLDKTTARISKFDAPIDRPVKFGTLTITVKACRKRPPEEPPESAAFLQVDETRPGDRGPVRVFSGWMFASSPALSAMDHPVYDIGVLDCKTDTASSGSSRKK